MNSFAMLLGMHEHGIRPDLIEYADPGKWLEEPAEKPETYIHMDEVLMPWLEEVDFPALTVVRHATDTLYQSCIRNGTLPSKAYGFSGCSVKFKHQLMEKHETELYGPEKIIIKAIGFHAGEPGRSDLASKGRYLYRYFLREWGWGQADCIAVILRYGLRVPIKSACHFCPSSKPGEVIWLSKNHPKLYQLDIAMEHNARPYHAEKGNNTKGLARRYSWEQIVKSDADQMDFLAEPDPLPCGCYDGGDEE